jgi:hypothetical protein
VAIKGKSRKRSKSRAPALPPRPAITSRKTPLVMRRDVKRAVVIVLAVLAFLGGLRVWQNVSRTHSLRKYDQKLTTAQGQFIQHFSPNVPTNVDQNLQNFQQGKVSAAAFLAVTSIWDKDFTASATAVGKLKTPNKVVAQAQFLIQQGIDGYARVARMWNFAAQIKQLGDATKDATIKKTLNDRLQVVLLEADDARRQGADKLYSEGAKQLTDLNVEWGLQKKQAPTQSGQTQ